MIMKAYLVALILLGVIFSEAEAQDKIFSLSRQSFAMDLFKNLSETNSLVISPMSIDIALSAIFFGSSQQAFSEFMTGLHYPRNYSMNLIQQNFQLLCRNMKKINGLEIATKIYINESLQAQPNYRSMITRVLNSGIESIAFKMKQEATDTINSWVAGKTHNMITKLIEPNMLNTDTSMVLLNCIYFKGFWLNAFQKNKTFSGDFFIDNTNTVPVNFMTTKKRFLYARYIEELGGASAVILPYKSSDMSMLLVLPQEKSGLPDLIKNISNYDWASIERTMFMREVNVTIPKFNISFERQIEKNLQEMGMKSMFDPQRSKLNRILSSKLQEANLYISTVIHKAVISVDEEGTVAAAATAVIAGYSISLDLYFIADHPFLFMLRSGSNIFFIGTYLGDNAKSPSDNAN